MSVSVTKNQSALDFLLSCVVRHTIMRSPTCALIQLLVPDNYRQCCPWRHLKSNACVRRNFKHTYFNLYRTRLIKKFSIHECNDPSPRFRGLHGARLAGIELTNSIFAFLPLKMPLSLIIILVLVWTWSDVLLKNLITSDTMWNYQSWVFYYLFLSFLSWWPGTLAVSGLNPLQQTHKK